MNDLVKNFIQKVDEQYKTGHAREQAYRPALQELFETVTGLRLVNDPKHSEHGAPDFVFLNKTIVTAYAEAKDLPVSLEETEKSDQMIRYYGYSNLILTNCLEFRFYKNGQQYVPAISIAKLKNGIIDVEEANFQLLEDTIREFIKDSKEPIKSGIHLAKVMAGKARRIRENIKVFLAEDDQEKNENLLSIYEVIKKLLLADLDKDKFADMYAQTVVYGLFAARYSDETPDTFSRQEACALVPQSNPFLRQFFAHIAGVDFDPRIEMIVNELCEEFNHADVRSIVHNYYKVDKDDSRDPIIHFYEDFLQEYDSAERKKMGVFYTPLPVVRFIVRAIDDILKKEFALPQGLADTAKIEREVAVQAVDGRYKDGIKKVKQQIHKVQLLDPATGTGTFLNEVILQIKRTFAGQEGRWNNYLNDDLLPRLHGFELMMASYTIAHLKLTSTIRETGAKLEPRKRLGVYLTNSLEKGEIEERNLFSSLGLGKAIADESNQANIVKHDLPIMVVLGNPPYSVSSQNKGKWISDLTSVYKEELKEKNIQPLSDDYIKFIRFAEQFIEKNNCGIVAMITNNSFLDGIIHRQMRKHLLETFDSIYILDLHGNAKKKETAPDGSKDENVFAIQQGVSISLFVKAGKKKNDLADVYHAEFYGRQKEKFERLNISEVYKIKWNKLDHKEPYYFFGPKDFSSAKDYEGGIKINEWFELFNAGTATGKDSIFVQMSKGELIKALNSSDIKFSDENIINYLYRPFDVRNILYDKSIIQRLRANIMDNMREENLALLVTSQNRQISTKYFFISNNVSDRHLLDTAADSMYVFPLYLYKNDGSKSPNLKKEIVENIERVVGKTTPEDILDYIYAVLHSQNYREKYKEFLKIDFPRVPYPKDKDTFQKLVGFGRELRGLHLLESPKLQKLITTFPEGGSDTVEKKYLKYKDGKVYINETQYFGGVTEVAWNFYIGGYQPAQKWLKDRQGRKLTSADLEHYQKIIIALTETDRIMKEIDKIIFE